MALPNQLTVLRIALTPVFAVSLTFEALWIRYLSLSIFFLASLTDWYDGYVARKHGNITNIGRYLDPLADKLLISTAFGMFSYLGLVQFWMFAVIAFRDFLITGLRSYALHLNKPFVTSNFAKWKTFCQMLAIYFVLIWLIVKETHQTGEPIPALMQDIENWDVIGKMMLFVTFFTLATGVSYLFDNRRHLKSIAISFYRVFVPTNVR
ncbi:MAG TPA: CDP-diacylglycerol--glycerol-3-phosphate 3-phosphatidyltransferase [bacterium]